MKRLGAPIVAVLVAAVALVFGGWWLFVRDTTVPGEGACDPRPPEALALEVVAEYPHDPEAYTQGLVFVGDELWESTGLRGESDLRRVDLATSHLDSQETKLRLGATSPQNKVSKPRKNCRRRVSHQEVLLTAMAINPPANAVKS